MDPQQIQGLPPGATVGQPVQQDTHIQGLPEGASVGQPVQQDTPASTESGQDESTDKTGAAGLAQYAENVGVGAAKGLESTTEGIGRLIQKIPGIGDKIIPQEGLAAENKQATPQGSDQMVGYAGENLAEFMLGDEALKGLSMA